jgi:hypothetical protein
MVVSTLSQTRKWASRRTIEPPKLAPLRAEKEVNGIHINHRIEQADAFNEAVLGFLARH